jgi:hypothetical protein
VFNDSSSGLQAARDLLFRLFPQPAEAGLKRKQGGGTLA